eukprot:TRINITY_DN18451_c0_g1_i1.p1 TRINITY_DN18451_c0_g1~~TRINITY_DN18451_c0_g1_i1.p1  ORF type:complete len:657 (+),score=207.01 TRINITY_DN18451_c0_g1_i1:125-2095(+)
MTSTDIADRLRKLQAAFPEVAVQVIREVVAGSLDEDAALYRLTCRATQDRDPLNEIYVAQQSTPEAPALAGTGEYSSLPTVKQLARRAPEGRIHCPACAERIEPKMKNPTENTLECPICSVAFSATAPKVTHTPQSRALNDDPMRANPKYPCCDYCGVQLTVRELREHVLNQHQRELEQLARLQEYNAEMKSRQPTLTRERKLSALMFWQDVLLREVFPKMDDKHTHQCKVDTACQVEALVRAMFPGAVVYLFGSTTTGVSEQNSDIDLAVKVSLNRTPPINEAAAVENLHTFFSQEGLPWDTWWEAGYAGDYGLRKITKTRVPILGNTPPLGAGPVDEGLDERTRSLRWTVPRTPEIMMEQERILKLGVQSCVIDSSTMKQTTTDLIGTFYNSRQMLEVMMKEDPQYRCSIVQPPNLFRVHWDLSLKHFGIRNSLLLRKYFNANYATKIAGVAVKIWSRKAGVNNPKSGLLSSYAIMIMYTYYLLASQRTPAWHPPKAIDPSVSPKESKPEYVGPPEGLALCLQEAADTLMGFFEFYGYKFNWDKHVITLNKDPNKELVTKTQLQWTDAHSIVVDRANSIRYYVCIEDPYEAADQVCKDLPRIKGMLNLGRKVTEYRLRKMQVAFKQAYEAMCQPGPNEHDILGETVRDIGRMMV